MLRERRRHANFKPNRKLDRKSSRGMIYENEELRLRTININAEVERGQSDIKKLRQENYQLRKEIWSLRDEYDRLGKLLKTKNDSVDEYGNDSIDCTNDCKYGCDYKDADRCCHCISNEDNISCDICHESESCTKQYNDRTNENAAIVDKVFPKESKRSSAANGSTAASMTKPPRNDKIDLNFDHLSIVSEECLSNNEEQMDPYMNGYADDPVTTKEFNSFKSTVPPLKHFENLSYRDIGQNLDSLAESEHDNEENVSQTSTPSVNEEETKTSTTPINKSNKEMKQSPKYFFSPLKSKRKMTTNSTEQQVEMPDVFIDNVLPSDVKKLATIRKPHKPLKCPKNSNEVASTSKEEKSEAVPYDIPNLSKGIDEMRLQKNQIYESVDGTKSNDSEQMHPFRSEMSLVLSYSGNKSKYTTAKDSDKTNDSDVDCTPPPKLPSAMELFPNKLAYGATRDRYGTEHNIEMPNNDAPKEVNKNAINKENNTNETMQSDSNIGLQTFGRRERMPDNIHNQNIGINVAIPKIKAIDVNDSPISELSTQDSNQTVKNADQSQNTNIDDDKSIQKQQDDKKDANKTGRRVSIHCNGKPLIDQSEAIPSHSGDCDVTCTDCEIEEPITLTPTSFRLRRASCNRKFSDESIGSLLYPPNPFYSYKRGKKSFLSTAFGSRRHSDIGLIPSYQPNHFYPEYNLPPKSRHHCHRNHSHHHHHHQIDACGSTGSGLGNNANNAIDGSTGTSLCNSLGSSRESSTSLSQRSTSKRKLSISSHSQGGKIPWCACWGNGCI